MKRSDRIASLLELADSLTGDTMRTGVRRFTRLTNAFSKKFENHCHSVSLHCSTTTSSAVARRSAAMAAGVTDQLWSIADLVALIDARVRSGSGDIFSRMNQERDAAADLEIVEGRAFGNDALVAVDGKHFKRCQFSNCTMLYSGGDAILTDCDIDAGSVAISLDGSAALTVKLLLSLGYSDLKQLISFPSVTH